MSVGSSAPGCQYECLYSLTAHGNLENSEYVKQNYHTKLKNLFMTPWIRFMCIDLENPFNCTDPDILWIFPLPPEAYFNFKAVLLGEFTSRFSSLFSVLIRKALDVHTKRLYRGPLSGRVSFWPPSSRYILYRKKMKHGITWYRIHHDLFNSFTWLIY